MAKRTTSYGATVFISSLIILCILIVVNYLSSLYFTRADLTEDKQYTISDATKKVLGGLEDLVTIQLYFSKELPTYVMPLRTQVEDLLDEYKAYSGGKLQVEYIDPEDDDELKQKLQFMGIPPVQLNVYQKDKAEVVTVYLGLAILYENKKEVIPVIQGTENLEYQLTSGIGKVTMTEVKSVGILPLTEGVTVDDSYSQLKESLQKIYDLKDIDLNGPRGMEKVDTLLVLGFKELTDWEKFQIDQAIMRGTNVIFMTDVIARERGQLGAKPAASNVNDLLENYGFKVNENLVIEGPRHCAMAAFSSGRFMQFQTPYGFWVKVGPDGLSDESPAVKQLSAVIFPWTSSIGLVEGDNSGVKYSVLARSSEDSWLQAGEFDLSPQQRFERTAQGSYELAVQGSGVFKSLFAGQEAPKPDNESARPHRKDEEVIAESQPTKIVVVGNSFMISDEFLTRYRKNDMFVQNLIDVMTLGHGLVDIRTRGAAERSLGEVSEGSKAWIKYGNMLGIPALVAVFGLVRYFIRKKRKRAL
ncbi:MAG: GldG family protein [Candidatus Coatesbacteria bacterium]|nr:GldG family protein [Candidatus Coatesbacteria bacterium]